MDVRFMKEALAEARLAAEAGVELVKVPFCYDAFVFLVNGQNPVDGLTVDQIRQIYTARLIEWGQVGGKEGLLIKAYQRPQNSGSQTALEALMGDMPLMEAEISLCSRPFFPAMAP